jgi:general secretion pathway protein G
MIVVTILGILAAIVIPEFSGHIQKAKESAAKDNLRLLRNAIERYAQDHNGVPPGYVNGIDSNGRHNDSKTPNGNYIYGPYLNDFPKNPFNNSITIMDLHDDVDMPESATGDNGWIYKAEGKEIRLDWPGTDSSGNLIYDY